MTVALVGDVMLGRMVNEALRDVPPESVWGNTLPLLLQSDLRVCNLECALSDRGTPWSETPKAFHFRSDAKNAAVLRTARMDLVSLANNHTLDFGYDALFDTLDTLDAAGIARAGAGRNMDEAARPVRVERSGVRFTFVAFTDNEPAWAATSARAGVYHVPMDPADHRFLDLLERLEDAKRETDVVIASVHWGTNWGKAPEAGHTVCARALVEHGADIVFGHSCHAVRGIGLEQGRPILYSAGDIIDDYAVDPEERNDRSFLYMVDTAIGPWHMRLLPTVIRRCRAMLASGEEAAEIAARMRRLCADLGTEASWDPRSRCLRIRLPSAPAAPLPHRHQRSRDRDI